MQSDMSKGSYRFLKRELILYPEMPAEMYFMYMILWILCHRKQL